MNKAVAPVEPKKVVSVEILHLDELGYGPQGKHTRREWRAECLENLLAGKEQFEAWQESWKDKLHLSFQRVRLKRISLGATLSYDDGSKVTVVGGIHNKYEPYTLDFVAHEFDDVLRADNIKYSQIVNFSNSVFKNFATFSSAIFERDAIFKQVSFRRFADFSDVKFRSLSNFYNTTFHEYTSFRRSTFTESTNFSSSTFIESSDFNTANFIFGGDFSDVRFTAYADFRSSIFTGHANFRSTTFVKDADFFKSKFTNQFRFDNEQDEETKVWSKVTQFYGAVNFENTEITNVGHFERVQFNGEIPNFLGVDNAKTLLIFSGDEYFTKKDTQGNATDRIAQLKRLSEEQGQIDQTLMFNALELNAKLAQARDKTQHLTKWQKINDAEYWFANATAGFRIFSDYGRSFFEPLKWYLALLGVTFYLAIAHAVYFTNKECPNEYANIFSYLWREQIQCVTVKPKDNETPIVLSGWRAAVEYTSYRASGILDFADSDKQTIAISNRLFNQPIEPPWMRAWGIFKGIASIALLFLAALGLRNKYRIK